MLGMNALYELATLSSLPVKYILTPSQKGNTKRAAVAYAEKISS